MQTTNSPSTRVNAQTREVEGTPSPIGSLLDLLTTPTTRPPSFGWDTAAPSHTMRFICGCDEKLLSTVAKELNIVVSHGDWQPFEVALTNRLEPVRHEISKTILAALGRVAFDSAHSSIVHGGYQIHLDTMSCFWLGHPETKANLENLVSHIVTSSTVFQDPTLNKAVTYTMVDSIVTGTLDLPHFEYAHLTPDFITMTCHPSVRSEMSRYITARRKSQETR